MLKSPVQAIDRAFSILRLLAGTPDGLKAGEISEHLQLKPTTVHGLLRSLRNWNAVEQDARRGTYHVGFGIYELSQAFSLEMKLRSVSEPILQSLSQEFSETVNLGVLRRFKVFTLVEVVPERSLPARDIPSRGAPPHTQARGKVLLAFADSFLLEKFREAFIASEPEAAYRALESELHEIRAQGYALVHHVDGAVASYSVPVFDVSGQAIGAVGLVVPRVRLPQHNVVRLVERMRTAASQIGVGLIAPGVTR